MSFSFMSWLKKMKAMFSGTRRSRPRSAARTSRSKRPTLEYLEDRLTPTTIQWVGGSTGNWDVAANWSSSPSLPGASDDVIVNTAATITIQNGDNISVNSLTTGSNDTLSFTGGSLSIAGNSTLSGAVTMSGASLAASGSGGTVTLAGAFSATGSSLTASGSGETLTATGTTSVSNSNLTANGGGTLALPNLTSYSFNLNSFQAYNTGSVLDLSALTTIARTGGTLTIQPYSGGQVNLNGLTTLPVGNVTIDDYQGGTLVDGSLTTLNGADATLANDAPAAASWTSFLNGSLQLEAGTYTLSNLTDVNGSNLAVSGGTLSLPNLTSYSFNLNSFQAYNTGSVLDLSALTTIARTGGTLTIQPYSGGQVNLNGLTTLPVGNVTIDDYQGGTLVDGSLTTLNGADATLANDAPAAASWTSFLNGSLQLEAGTYTLSNLTDVNGSNLAVSGGTLSLPNLTSYSFNLNSFQAYNTGSVLDLSALTTIARTGGTLTIQPYSGGQVNLNGLTTLPVGNVTIDDYQGGTLVDGSLTTLNGADATLANDAPAAASWTSFLNGSLQLEAGTYTLSNLTDVDGSNLAVSGGTLALPNLTSYSFNLNSFQAFNTGSVLDLSALTTIARTGGTLTIQPYSGGQVNLNGLTTLPVGNVAINDYQGGTLLDGSLTTINGDGATLANDAAAAASWTSFVNGTLVINAGTYTLPNLTDVDGSNLAVSGGTLALPNLTSYSFNNNSFQAYNTGSVLDLSALTTIARTGGTLTIQPYSGGQVNLNGLTTLPVGNVAIDDYQGGTLLDGSLPTINGDGATLANDAAAAASWTSFVNGTLVINAGTYTLPNLTDVDDSNLAVTGGTLALPDLTSYTGSNNTLQVYNTGSVLNLSALATNSGGNLYDFSNATLLLAMAPNETVNLNGSGYHIDPSSTGTGSISGSVLNVTGAGSFVIKDPSSNTVATVLVSVPNQMTGSSGVTATGGEEGITAATLANATFTDSTTSAPATSFTVTAASWGDGSTATAGLTVSGSNGNYTVNGSHLYTAAGTYNFSITVTGVGNTTATITGSSTVADAPLTAGALTPPLATQGKAFTNQVVFHLTDADPAGTASDYTAVVTPGDGTSVTLTSTASPSGQIVANTGGGFDVQLSYTYATALSNKTFGVVVTDDGSQASASTTTFDVYAAPAITTATLLNSTTYQAYTQTLTTTGGAPPLTFAVSAGSLPPGLNLNSSSGVISGAASTAGSYSFTITATDLTGATATHAYSIGITSSLFISQFVPAGTVGQFYNSPVAVTGGTGPLTFSLVSGSQLPPGLTMSGSGILTGTPTAAGSYLPQISIVDATGTSTKQTLTFTIARATPTVRVSDAGGTYSGTSFPATATVAGLSGPAAASLESVTPFLTYYTGSTASGTPLAGAPTNAGTYTVVASFTGSTDYTTATASATFTIAQATPTVSVSDAGGTYSGTSFPAAATVTGVSGPAAAGLESVTPTLTYYTGSTASGTPLAGAPTNAGTYTVVTSFTGSTDYTAATASATFTIAKASSTTTVVDAGGTYSGAAFPATSSTVTGVGGLSTTASSLDYKNTTTNTDLGATAPSSAGHYSVTATYNGDANHTASTSSTVTFTIAQATPTVAVGGLGIYNNTPLPATATVTGVNGPAAASLESVTPTLTYYAGSTASGTPLAGAPTNAGTYTVVTSFTGSTDYTAATASATFTIAKASSTTKVVDAGGTYSGAAFPATSSTVTGVGGLSTTASSLDYKNTTTNTDLGSTAPSSAGHYSVTATYNGDANHTASTSSTVTFTIAPASSTTTVVDAGGPYSGAAFPATHATATGVGGLSDTTLSDFTFSYAGSGSTTYGPSASAPVSLGSYTVVASYKGDANHNTSTSSATAFSITQPPAVTSIQVGVLQFQISGTGNFTQSGSTSTTTSLVQVGFIPSSGQTFQPLMTLQGTVTINTSAATFSSTGAVTAIVSSTSLPLLNSIFSASIASLTGTGVIGLTGLSLTTAGLTNSFTLNSLALAKDSAGKGYIKLQGSLTLLSGLTVAASGTNYVDISSSGVSLTGITASLTGSFSEGGVSFSASNLTVSYSGTNNTFDVTGSASATVTGIANLVVSFGNAASPGLVITNGALTQLDTTVTSRFMVGGLTFTTDGLNFDYQDNTFALTGSAGVAIGGMGNLNVKFGHTSTTNGVTTTSPGLVITGNSLTHLDMTVNSTFTVSSLTFTATDLEFTWDAANSALNQTNNAVFTLTGTAGVAITNMGTIDVTFGHTSTTNGVTTTSPGLVIAGSSLTHLDMTVNSTFKVSSVTFTATDLEFTWDAANTALNPTNNAVFTLTGTAGVAITNMGTIDVTFGHTSTTNGITTTSPGLVINGSALTHLDMTVNSTFTVGSVTFTATGLEFTWDAANSALNSTNNAVFTLTGTAGVAIQNMGTIDVTFGHTSTTNGITTTSPGLVITGSSLTHLDMTVNSTFTVGSLTFTATDLEFTWDPANTALNPTNNAVFTLTGTAGVAITNMGTIDVTFGHTSTTNGVTTTSPGLVIDGSTLTHLDTTVNGTFKVGQKLTFTATNLEFTWDPANTTLNPTNHAVFTLTGTAGVSVTDVGEIAVTFGHSSTTNGVTTTSPGLVINGSTLTSLDMTIDGDITIDRVVEIYANGLEFTYTSATDTITIPHGSVGATIPLLTSLGVTNDLNVTFGSPGQAGLVITDGALTSFDVSLNGTLAFPGVSISGTVEATWNSTSDQLDIDGSISANVLSIATLQGTADLVISNCSTNATLTSLTLNIEGAIAFGGVSFANAQLDASYVGATQTFTMTGTASITLPLIGSGTAYLGVDPNGNPGATPGLVITDGQLTSLGLIADANFSVGGMGIAGDLDLTYHPATTTTTPAHSVTVPSFTFFGGSKPVTYNVPATTTTTPSQWIATGSATATFGTYSVSVDLGGTGSQGLIITNGVLTNLDMTVTGTRSFFFIQANLTLHAVYTASPQSYYFTGTAGVSFSGSSLPSWVEPFFGSGTISLADAGFAINYIPNDNADSYVDVYTSVAGQDVGIQVDFNGDVSISLGNGIGQVFQVIAHDATEAFDATAAAVAKAANAISNGVSTAASFTEAALSTAYNNLSSAASTVGNTLEQGASELGSTISTGLSDAGSALSTGASDLGGDISSGLSDLGLGPIEGGTLYFDVSNNFDLATDPSTTTAADGGFATPVPTGSTSGQLVGLGGTDLSTGLPVNIVLTAPYDSTYVTPLTTLVNDLMLQTPQLSEAQANALVDSALGISPTIDLSHQNSLLQGLAGDPTSAQAFAAEVKVTSLVSEEDALIGGLPGAASPLSLSTDALASLAFIIDQTSGAALDLSDPSVVQTLIQEDLREANLDPVNVQIPGGALLAVDPLIVPGTSQVATAAPLTLDPTVASGAATVMAGVSQSIDSLAPQINTLPTAVAISGASNDAPIVITSPTTGLTTGMRVALYGVNGNTAANGFWTVTVIDANHFSLDGSDGTASGAYTSGGAWVSNTGAISDASNASPIVITTGSTAGLQTGQTLTIAGVNGNTAANGFWTITVLDGTTFALSGSDGTASRAYTSGGDWNLLTSYLTQVVQAQVVAEGTIAPQLAQVTAATINNVVSADTGTNLSTQIGAATIGDLDPPGLAITPIVEQSVGAGDATTYEFTVTPIEDSPVNLPFSVSYTTADLTATAANGDYDPVSGTLTWAPGDLTPQTISVPVNVTANFAQFKLFALDFSNPTNATLPFANAVGVIDATDVGTTTTLASSDLNPTVGEQVTLTATVVNQDPAADAGNGTVAFYDDAQELGTADLVNGVASFTTTLDAGSPEITAVYEGWQLPGVSYEPSQDTVTETVAPANQAITFGPLADQVYGALPFAVNATVSSGLPASYSIVSGPATIVGNVVTITGAGTVVVEASQPGESDYNAAPVVDQSFTVDPAPLTFTVDNQSMVYGDPMPTLTGTFSGFTNGDGPDGVAVQPTFGTVPASSGVGSYAITASGAVDPNYAITYVPGTLTITPAPLLISADLSMTYGQSPAQLTPTYTGLVNGDTPASLTTPPTVSTTVTSATYPGSYTASVDGAVDANYDISYAPGTLVVNPAPLTITADNQTMVYGGTMPTLTATYSGFFNNDSPDSLTTFPTESTVPAGSYVGSYPIVAYGAVDPNYVITYVPGTLTITPANATLTVNDGVGPDTAFQASTTTIAANWTGFVATGINIANYQWAIGTTPGGTDVQAFTSVGTATSATATGLSLTNGTTYYVSVMASDNAGNVSSTAVSTGVTVDNVAPTSTVAPLPATTASASFLVSWSGSDNPGGSGVASYSIYVSEDNGAFQPFLLNTTQTSATFSGAPGHTYGFYSVATDNVGNTQAIPTVAQASIAVAATPDLVGQVAQDGEWWLDVSNGSNTFTNVPADFASNWVNVQVGDFIGNGQQELAGMDPKTGQWYVALPNGSGGFTPTPWGAPWTPLNWLHVVVGNFTGNGLDDIAAMEPDNGQWWVAVSNGSTFTTSKWGTPWTPDQAGITWDVQVGDFNGDGKDDLVGFLQQDAQWWVNTSTGSSFQTTLGAQWAPINWLHVVVGDFTGNGQTDLAAMEPDNGQWWVAVPNGSTFTTSKWGTPWTPDQAGITWDVRVGDFNGDGKDDLVGFLEQDGEWWVGTSTGSSFQTSKWAQWTPDSPSMTWTDFVVGDFTGDGMMDIAAFAPQNGQWWVNVSNGSSFSSGNQPWTTWSTVVTWVNVNVGDFA